ncbi:MAG: nucleotidyltransferase family protein [Microcella sp.]|uniref:nucleotidyltransferase family protein n=1 Tax=Microcella sp. TaxID=1913979 RepID=UPI0033148A66
MNTSIQGVLLAAGSGTRYGMPKALAQNGAWLADAVSALLGGGCHGVVLVLGAADATRVASLGAVDLGNPLVTVVQNDDWQSGMAGSVRAGLDTLEHTTADLAVILLVDTPDVEASIVARVIDAVTARDTADLGQAAVPSASRAPRGDARDALARAYFGSVPGHPVAVGRHHWRAITSTARGDEGARRFLHDHPELIRVPCEDLATGIDHDVAQDRRDGS